MYNILAELSLTAATAPSGLVEVTSPPNKELPLDEQVAIRQASLFSPAPDYVFFRRFADNRASQVAAYVVDNSNGKCDESCLTRLHHTLWLSGATTLLYVGWVDRVDILTCAAGKTVKQNQEWKYDPIATIKTISDISDELLKRYSAYRLADGTFWEDRRNANFFDRNKAAHKVLIDKVKKADEDLNGAMNPTARRLLLLTLLIKYLEDRHVFPEGWFASYHQGATSFYDVIKSGNVSTVQRMLKALENKFNGDIFVLPTSKNPINQSTLTELARVIHPRPDTNGQLYFWDIYSFRYIPVEVLSHIYQHFAEKGKGAVFTPPLLVDLILDQVLPLKESSGKETVFDPSCGSGIFLVSAFRRLVQIWLANNEWKKPTPSILKQILQKSIFGIEIQGEAAHVASFSLALAICDALLPEIIWKDLKFDKLIGSNLFIGDFGSAGKAAMLKATRNKGFDVIVGNPPFKSELTESIEVSLRDDDENIQIPDKQLAYFFLNECTFKYLSGNGRICMIQPYGFLYNKNTAKFRNGYFEKAEVKTVLDFISVRKLFSGADTKIIAIHASNNKPKPSHEIQHWTFRRTFATESHIVFELDHYDYHTVPQHIAAKYPWVWRTNLLGGGRLFQLAKRLKRLPTIENYINSQGWVCGEGTNRGNRSNTAEWLTKYMDSLSTTRFVGDDIGAYEIEPLMDIKFEATRRRELFTPPIVVIKENSSLPCAYWDKGPLAYNHSVVGISAPPGREESLKQFRSGFIQARKYLKAALYLFGSRGLTSKSSAILKHEIISLPWPENGAWEMVLWEKELAEDITKYMAEFVLIGQNSKLLQRTPVAKDLENYRKTFQRLLQTSFPSVVPCGSGASDGLRFEAFSFGAESRLEWLQSEQWLTYLRSTVFHEHGQSMRTVRVARLYDENTLVLIKPDLLRYWIRSTAIRDVDGTIADILSDE